MVKMVTQCIKMTVNVSKNNEVTASSSCQFYPWLYPVILLFWGTSLWYHELDLCISVYLFVGKFADVGI